MRSKKIQRTNLVLQPSAVGVPMPPATLDRAVAILRRKLQALNRPSEKKVESDVCDYAKEMGVLVFKLTPMGERGWPDRMFLYQQRLLFVEFKAEGGRLSALQRQRMKQLRERNLQAVVIHKTTDGIAAVDSLIQTSQ